MHTSLIHRVRTRTPELIVPTFFLDSGLVLRKPGRRGLLEGVLPARRGLPGEVIFRESERGRRGMYLINLPILFVFFHTRV